MSLAIRHLEKTATGQIPVVPVAEFRRGILDGVAAGGRLAAFFGASPGGDTVRLTAVLADDRAGELRMLATEPGETYPALAAECPQAAGFEREIAEQWGVVPEGHRGSSRCGSTARTARVATLGAAPARIRPRRR